MSQEKKLTARGLAKWQGYLTLPELEKLQELTKSLDGAPVIVKIGAGAGTDSLAMLEVRDDLVIFSIDIRCCDSPTVTNEHLRLPEAGRAKTGEVIRIWGDSKIVGKRWPIPVDMIFIDGDHSEAGKRGDIETWLPKMGHGGIVAFHNYGSEAWPAVKPVIDELMAPYEKIAEIDSLIAFRYFDPVITNILQVSKEMESDGDIERTSVE